jgi:TATA-binding protein-associated factor Taf7
MKTRLQDLLDKDTLRKLTNSKTKATVNEANSDGTISKDENRKRAEMLKKFENELNKMVNKYATQAEKIGGPFRKDGIKAEMSKILNKYYLGL